MSERQGIGMKAPCHPGEFVKYEIVEALGLSEGEAADRAGVAPADFSALLGERTYLSPDLAQRIERAFGVSGATLLRMQRSYDAARADRERLAAPPAGGLRAASSAHR